MILSGTNVSRDTIERRNPACLVSITRLNRRSLKARFPTKLTRSFSTTRPSEISKTRSTRLSVRRMIFGVTCAASLEPC